MKVSVTDNKDEEIELPDELQLSNFFSQYRQVMMLYESAIQCVTMRLDMIGKESKLHQKRTPIRSVSSRIKEPQSIYRKLQTRGFPLTLNSIKENLNDVAGIRVVCEYVRDAYAIRDDQYFYDLCDERGMIVWAEIPYISQHMPGGRENTISQMTELITQNYNHPSVVVWSLSNEISMKGADDPDLIENHRILNDLAHKLDKTRLTTLAALSTCPIDSEYLHIPDTVSYNHYFGWYGGRSHTNTSGINGLQKNGAQ